MEPSTIVSRECRDSCDPSLGSSSETDSEPLVKLIKKTSNVFECDYEGCNAVYTRKSRFDLHQKKHTGERLFKCSVEGCSKDYTQMCHLKRHENLSHGVGVQRVKCPIKDCLQEVSSTSLKRHIYRQHNENRKYRFKCEECGEGLHRKFQLYQHSYLHTGIKPIKCEICEERFLTVHELNRHQRSHNYYICKCGEIFDGYNILTAHQKTCQLFVKESKCEICNKCFSTPTNLKQHLKIHNEIEDMEIYFCSYEGCDRYYKYKRNLTLHIQSFHLKNKKKKIP